MWINFSGQEGPEDTERPWKGRGKKKKKTECEGEGEVEL